MDERKKTPDTSIIIKQHIQEPVNPRKRKKIKQFNLYKKSSPSVNDFFERKQIIEDLESELTGSPTKIG